MIQVKRNTVKGDMEINIEINENPTEIHEEFVSLVTAIKKFMLSVSVEKDERNVDHTIHTLTNIGLDEILQERCKKI